MSKKSRKRTLKIPKGIRVTPETNSQIMDLAGQYDASQTDVYGESVDAFHKLSAFFGTTTFKDFAVALDRLRRQGERAKAVEGGDNGY